MPCAASSAETFALMFDLPVPPRYEWTATITRVVSGACFRSAFELLENSVSAISATSRAH